MIFNETNTRAKLINPAIHKCGWNEKTGETEEQWSGDYIFKNEWQSFRAKKDRSLELTSIAHECTPRRHKIAVKMVGIFGNDTMKILEVGA